MILFSGSFVFGEYPARIDLINPNSVFLHQGVSKVSGEGGKATLGCGISEQGGFSTMGIHTTYINDTALISF